jgi:glycine cleavage system H protein
MSDFPEDLRFTADHLWVTSLSDSLLRVGITDFAQDSLGDVVAITPPEVGCAVRVDEPCGEIESTKSVSELISPVTGTIEETNQVAIDSPEIVNSDPYGQGWLFQVRIDLGTASVQLRQLMDAAAYQRLIGE